ncbi:alpha/beta-hydrolase [Hysterangium stoloniferum]|nr:alpha/beta-hydrolase [Hysterangium stoloniferum]
MQYSTSDRKPRPVTKCVLTFYLLVSVVLVTFLNGSLNWHSQKILHRRAFYSHITSPRGVCNSVYGDAKSHAGYIGLEGDSETNPRRSFFWYFEAAQQPQDAPLILSIGGGPGTSGMANPLLAQSPCLVVENNTTEPNEHSWTERYNLIALDHPIGVGYSYGAMVNNSRSAAEDVYDFLQKFFVLFPHLAANKFIVTSGSYGGIYVPNIGSVIHEQNKALAMGKGQPNAVHINLESLVLSNPLTNPRTHFRWWLHQACYNTNIYNTTTCSEFYAKLPDCLDKIDMAFENFTTPNRVAAWEACFILRTGDTHGVPLENPPGGKKCNSTELEDCYPYFMWLQGFMNSNKTREQLGVPDHLQYSPSSIPLFTEFMLSADVIQPAHLLYTPLLNDGIRLLHYIGARDVSVSWPGVLSTLQFIQSPYREEFNSSPDVPWPTADVATVRAVGKGAGKMTYILIADAGHFVSRDQPALSKKIIEHWIEDRPFY